MCCPKNNGGKGDSVPFQLDDADIYWTKQEPIAALFLKPCSFDSAFYP
jgi:hypothetical protein